MEGAADFGGLWGVSRVGCRGKLRVKEGIDGAEARGEMVGGAGDPLIDLGAGEPLAVADFGGVELERPPVLGGKNFDKFEIGVAAGGDFGEASRVGDVDAQFLGDFADGGVVVGFAGVEVATGGGIPFAGVGILGEGAFLEEEALVVRVEDEDMDGAVEKVPGMDLGAAGGADRLVVFIDHVEAFVGIISHGRGIVGRP